MVNFKLNKKKIIWIIILSILGPLIYIFGGLLLCHSQTFFFFLMFIFLAPGLFITQKIIDVLGLFYYPIVFLIQIIYFYIIWSLIQKNTP